MFYFYKFFWSVLRSKALETPQLGFRELNGRKSCWTCQTFSGTFSGILLNLTWTFSRTFSGTFSGTLLNLTWLCTKASRNLLWNPVEPDLALHQTLPEPSPERSPEPCWTWPGFAPKPPRPSPEPSSEPSPDWLCTKASHTFSGTLLNLTWLWTKAFQTFCETSSGMFSGTLLYVTWLCTKASQTLSGTFGTQSKNGRRLLFCVFVFLWAEKRLDKYRYYTCTGQQMNCTKRCNMTAKCTRYGSRQMFAPRLGVAIVANTTILHLIIAKNVDLAPKVSKKTELVVLAAGTLLWGAAALPRLLRTLPEVGL